MTSAGEPASVVAARQLVLDAHERRRGAHRVDVVAARQLARDATGQPGCAGQVPAPGT